MSKEATPEKKTAADAAAEAARQVRATEAKDRAADADANETVPGDADSSEADVATSPAERPDLNRYTRIASGKVRDIYEVDDDTLMLVTSDRISAFDYILETPIPDKGRILTAMSYFFFDYIDFPNHIVGTPDDPRIPESVLGRAMLCKRLKMVPYECVARGYLTGSALKEYRREGSICDVELPDGLTEASRLKEPIFTPATKAEIGDHDENVSYQVVVNDLGDDAARELRAATLKVYLQGAQLAKERGVIVADTKFEFGIDDDGVLRLADEVLTPDSSRYWPEEKYEIGRPQPSFDKQFVRNWLSDNWNGVGIPPQLPDEVVEFTRSKYIEAYERISGKSFDDWYGASALDAEDDD